jgi:hypothetical protein
MDDLNRGETRQERKTPVGAARDTKYAMRVRPAIVRFGRDLTASRSAIIRYAGQHLGFLAGS